MGEKRIQRSQGLDIDDLRLQTDATENTKREVPMGRRCGSQQDADLRRRLLLSAGGAAPRIWKSMTRRGHVLEKEMLLRFEREGPTEFILGKRREDDFAETRFLTDRDGDPAEPAPR